ncbi:F-actin-uncapping protein LRRC16A-like isoform X2 [Dysidea avara]|uniref:F-actin-uncapping protein LRRC16A-like isoform X2 n=1 Tax=Dysidea avara TaxID=196820 RepID=UPI00331E06A1
MTSELDIYGNAFKLTSSEQTALGGSTQVCLRKEVQLFTGKKDQLEPRVLVLTTSRCHILSARQPGKVESSFHFLKLSRIESPGAKQLLFYLNGEGQPRKFNMVADNDCMEVTVAVVSQVRNVLPAAPKDQLVAMQFQPANRMQQTEQLLSQMQDAMQPTDISVCGGYITTYGFMADYYGCQFRDEVSWDINNIYTSHGFRQLNLADFHHLDPKDLQPIISALRYNKYFDGLTEKNFKMANDLFEMMGTVFVNNTSLKTLSLDNVGMRGDHVTRIFTSVNMNKKNSIVHVDLSNNHLDDKGFETLAQALEGLPHGLVTLSLANTGLSSRAASILSAAMTKNSHCASSLTKLDWSGNPLGPDSQAALAFLQDNNCVTQLNLSNCQLHLDTVLASLRRGCCQHLTHLDLSGNNRSKKRESTATGKVVSEFFSKVIAVETINMSGCKLSAEAATGLLKGISNNPNIIKVTLNISSNELGVGSMKECISYLGNMTTLHSLDISDNGLENYLELILKALLPNTGIKHLAIGKNFKAKGPGEALNILVTLLNKNSAKLESLSVADSKLREYMSILLDGLGANNCLNKIDVSGNDMGDRGGRLLAKLLLVNNSLHTILWDHNLTGLAGFEDVANALEHNCTMRSMPMPLSDVRGSRDLAAVETVVQRIQQLLFRNHSPARSMVELESRRNKYAHIVSSRQQELDHSLVQLEDLLKMIPKESSAEPSVQKARTIKDEAYKVSQLTIGLYPPKLESEQANEIREQLQRVATPLQNKLFQEQLQETSERMVSLCDKTCPTVFGQDEAKEGLKALITSNKEDHFLENELVTVTGQEVTTCISGLNLDTSSAISQYVFDQVLQVLEGCIEQLMPLKQSDTTDAPLPKPKPRPVSYKVLDEKKEKDKRHSKTPLSPTKLEKLPELETEAPMKNATITKSRAPRPNRTHRVTRPSQMTPSSDLIDAPSSTILEEPSPSTTPTPVSPKSPSSKSPLIPGKSPVVSPTPGSTSSEEKKDDTSTQDEEQGQTDKQDDVTQEDTSTKQSDEAAKPVQEEAKQDTMDKKQKTTPKDDKKEQKEKEKQQKEKEKEEKRQQKEREKEEKRLQKEKEKLQKEKEKEEKKQQKGAKKPAKGKDTESNEVLEASQSTEKRASIDNSIEVSQETELSESMKKGPPPTRAKPKKPPETAKKPPETAKKPDKPPETAKKPDKPPETVKKPVLPPGAVPLLPSVGKKQAADKAPPTVAKKPSKNKPEESTDKQDTTDGAGDEEVTNKNKDDGATKDGDKPADKDGDKPADKDGDKPADKDGDKPADKDGDKPADKDGDKPADKADDKPADKDDDDKGKVTSSKDAVNDKTDDKPTEDSDRVADKDGDKPADKDDDKPADKDDDKPADKDGDKPTNKDGDKSADKDGDKPADKDGDKPADKDGDKPADKDDDKPTDKDEDKPTEDGNKTTDEGTKAKVEDKGSEIDGDKASDKNTDDDKPSDKGGDEENDRESSLGPPVTVLADEENSDL